MITFIGEESCKIDAKGRMLFPASFTRQLGDDKTDSQSFVIRRGLHNPCLELYTLEEWQNILAKMRKKLNMFRQKDKMFLSHFMRGAAELRFDGSKRLLIPKRLLEELNIQKDAVLVGSVNYIEIWSNETFKGTQISNDDLANMAMELLEDDFSLEDEE